MPSLQQRVYGRGYAAGVDTGQLTGEASLEATQAVRRPASSPFDWHQSPSTLTGFRPEGPPPPAGYEMPDVEQGLPGGPDPDPSPGYGPGYVRTHAAPMPGWAGSYHDTEAIAQLHRNSAEIHGEDFGQAERLRTVYDVDHDPVDVWTSNDPGGHTGQAPLTGAQRVLGGMDAIQGYDKRNRFGFDAGHRSRQARTTPQPMFYLDPAERPLIVPQAQGSFTPTDAVQGPEPWQSDLHGASVNYTDPSAYTAAPAPATNALALTEALPSAGWASG